VIRAAWRAASVANETPGAVGRDTERVMADKKY